MAKIDQADLRHCAIFHALGQLQKMQLFRLNYGDILELGLDCEPPAEDAPEVETVFEATRGATAETPGEAEKTVCRTETTAPQVGGAAVACNEATLQPDHAGGRVLGPIGREPWPPPAEARAVSPAGPPPG